MQIGITPQIYFQENDYISPLVESIVKSHDRSELVSPSIVSIIKENDLTCFFRGVLNPNFCSYNQPLREKSYSENREYNNFILKCDAVIEEITIKHKSIFYTVHEDRFILSKAITMLSETCLYYLSMFQKTDTGINELKRINHHLESFNRAIQICESFKRKRVSNSLLELPIHIQKHIFSLSPGILQKEHFEKIKYIYKTSFKHSIFNKEILPSLISQGFYLYPSALELAEMAPHLKSIDIADNGNKILPEILKVSHITDLKAVRHLRISDIAILSRFCDHINTFTNLRELKISKHSPFTSLDSLTSSDITLLKPLKNLQKLELISLTAKSIKSLLETIASMPILETLCFGIWVNHDNLKELAQLKELKPLKNFQCIAYTNSDKLKHKHISQLLFPLNPRIEIRWLYSFSETTKANSNERCNPYNMNVF